MVGVTGKSRACNDCRRRRVKCDLRKPTCLRCEKAKITCQGYERATIFVNRTLDAPATNARSAISKFNNEITRTRAVPTSARLQILQRLTTAVSNQLCAPTELRDQAWDLLKDLYLPKTGTANEFALGDSKSYAWLPTACKLRGKSNALDRSLVAFCATQVHIAEPGSTLPDAGLQLYNEALQELVKDLKEIQEKISDETLAAIVVLSTCELFILTNPHSWSAHAQGISEILRHRNATEELPPVWRSLCARLRIVCVVIGLINCKSLALEADKWRQLIREKRTATSFETVMDIISEVPHLMEETDAVLADSGGSFSSPESDLFRSLFYAVQKLHAWQENFRLIPGKPKYWAVPSKCYNPSDENFPDKLFPFALEFESLDLAMPMILSCSVMTQLLAAMLRLHLGTKVNEEVMDEDTIDSHIRNFFNVDNELNPIFNSNEHTSVPVPVIKAMADKVARFLCQSIEYCHRIEMGTLGPQATCHAQWSLTRYFRQAGLERELDWCMNIKNMTGPNYRCNIEFMLLK